MNRLLLGLALCACEAPDEAPARPPPDDTPIPALTVEVTGRDYGWIVRYPGPDGVLGTPDDVTDRRDLHLPKGARVTVRLSSEDYVYSFAVPRFRVRKMAVPDVPFEARFVANAEGTFDLLGDPMCGYSHDDLRGKVVVVPPAGFRAWMQTRRAP